MMSLIFVDPLNAYTHVSEERIVESCGLIPGWIDYNDERSFQEQITAKYGFPIYEMTGGNVDVDGVYCYPGDPELRPLVKWQRDGETMYMYEYAIVAFVKDGKTFVTRVD